MRAGGFGVVIGNPPYVQLAAISDYTLVGYRCLACKNIYPVVLERCLALGAQQGRQGFIVPVSSISTDGYSSLQENYLRKKVHVSCFDDRPSRLFDGLQHIRLSIFLIAQASQPGWYSTRYHKWYAEERYLDDRLAKRPTLFEKLYYQKAQPWRIPNSVPKLTAKKEVSLLKKLENVPVRIENLVQSRGDQRRGGGGRRHHRLHVLLLRGRP